MICRQGIPCTSSRRSATHHCFLLFFLLSQDFTPEDPSLHTYNAIGCVSLCKPVINVGSQRMQRHPAFAVPFGSRDLSAAQTSGTLNFNALRAHPHGS